MQRKCVMQKVMQRVMQKVKKGLCAVLLAASAGLLAAPQLQATVHEDTAPNWVIKAAYDYSIVDTPSDEFDGLNNDNARNFLGVDPRRDIDGNISGFNVAVGRLLHHDETPSLVSLDFTYRSGDLDGAITYHGGTFAQITNSVDVDRTDVDLKILYQWLGQRWQPYLGIGYLYYEKDVKDRFPTDSNWTWSGTGTQVGSIYKELNGLTFGGGLGVNIAQFKIIEIKAKAELFAIYGNGELTDDREPGVQSIDGTNWGYMSKATLMLNFPFTLKDNHGGIFIDLGYQYQQFNFNDAIGSSDKWYGPYGRIGVGLVF